MKKEKLYNGNVYKFENKLNGKIYIGQSRCIERRYEAHVYCDKPMYELDRAIKKYGIENFNYEILESFDTENLEEVNKWMDEREDYYIQFYNSLHPNGYNLLSNRHHPEFSELTRKRISEACMGEKNGFYGKKHSEETKKKMSESAKKRGNNHPDFVRTQEMIDNWKVSMKHHFETMTDEEIIKISKSEFLGQNIRSSLKINRPLINQLRKRNIIYIVFPDSDKSYYNADYWVKLATEKWGDTYDYSYVHSTYRNWKGKVKIGCKEHGFFEQSIGNHLSCGCPKCSRGINFYKQEKLLLLTKYDLEGMDWAVIMDLIGEDKLPKEFYCLCKFGPNTEGRKQQIEKLKEFYNVESDELEDTANEIIEQTVSNIDDETYSDDSDENELKTYEEIDTLADILKVEEKEIYSTGDKYIHIFEKEMSKLWGLVLRDNESHSTKNVEFISKKLNDKNITPFAKHIYEEFMKEYEKVISFEAA